MLVGTPTTVQPASGSDRLVLANTLNDVPAVALLKANWNTPGPAIATPTIVGAVTKTACFTGMVWPSKVMFAVRVELSVLALKLKLTTPLVTPLMVNQGWSLVGANGGSRFTGVGGATG